MGQSWAMFHWHEYCAPPTESRIICPGGAMGRRPPREAVQGVANPSPTHRCGNTLYRQGATSVKHRRNRIRSYQHFVWTTRDRHPLVTAAIERDLYRYIETVCDSVDCPVLAIGGMPDHVHLLVSFPATLSYSELMNRVKGGSSRFVSEKLLPDQWFAWRANYAVFSVSPRHKPITIAYINRQKEHHQNNKLWPSVEALDEDSSEYTH